MKLKRTISGAAIIAVTLSACVFLSAADDTPVPYPKGYRGWTFLHSSIVGGKQPGFWKPLCDKPCTAGVFNFYANEKAMEGIRTGVYGDGAIIAEELLELLGRDNGSASEGPRRLVGVMMKDSKKYGATGGWGFGKYDGTTLVDELDSAGRSACFQCHIPRKDRGYVFTEYKER